MPDAACLAVLVTCWRMVGQGAGQREPDLLVALVEELIGLTQEDSPVMPQATQYHVA